MKKGEYQWRSQINMDNVDECIFRCSKCRGAFNIVAVRLSYIEKSY